MNQLFASLVLVAAAATSAVADPIALDYRATDPSCIDAGQFADEVSAKLGFVPWDDTAPARIQVRVARAGSQFSGSFRNVDDRAKQVDGASCAEVTSSLAVTVAAALDRAGSARVALIGSLDASADVPPEAAPDDGLIPVTIVSADGRRVDVSLNNRGAVATTTRSGAVFANYLDGLCTSPCTARLPRGRHYLVFHDPDSASSGGDRFLLDDPTTITLHHKSRKGLRRGMFAAGVAMAGAGLVALIGIDGAGPKILGGLGLSFGGALMLSPLYVQDTFTATTRSP
ncbi:MAG: hypothetical protein ACTHU0_23780 [Kofleriaceae bacterium]